MKSIKVALLGGAALAVTAVAAHADDLSALKAQVEALNARVAAMETAPSVPAGYNLIAISSGDLVATPGLQLSSREQATFGSKSTIISVMPTADAPAGASISWSGYVRAAAAFTDNKVDASLDHYENGTKISEDSVDYSNTTNDKDVDVRGQMRVVAKTDTAVGEVGVELKARADFNGANTANMYMKTAWGYWAMTPELTLGGGYTGSLGNVGYGYDGACTCIYTDSADVALNPGDTTQMRLTYGSGPLSMAVALEDASAKSDAFNGEGLGVAGQMKYSGDMFSGSINGVWRSVDQDSSSGPAGGAGEFGPARGLDDLWQIGAGLGMSIGEMASISLAAAMGHGPYVTTSDGEITNDYTTNNDWYGMSALASVKMSDEIHAEAAVGYKHRETEDFNYAFDYTSNNVNYTGTGDWSGFKGETWAVLGGVYYQPVDQLTLGLEGEYSDTNYKATDTYSYTGNATENEDKYDISSKDLTVDLVSVWRF